MCLSIRNWTWIWKYETEIVQTIWICLVSYTNELLSNNLWFYQVMFFRYWCWQKGLGNQKYILAGDLSNLSTNFLEKFDVVIVSGCSQSTKVDNVLYTSSIKILATCQNRIVRILAIYHKWRTSFDPYTSWISLKKVGGPTLYPLKTHTFSLTNVF